MRVNCTICTDIFLSDSDISVTDCGHAFHTACIYQWLERSKTCPQCRRKTLERKLVKLFLDHVSSTQTDTDPDRLKLESDGLKAKVTQLNLSLDKVTSEKDDLAALVIALRDEVASAERKLGVKDDTIAAQQMQLRCLSDVSKQRDKCRTECDQLRSQLKHLVNVEKLVKQSSEDVEDMLASYPATSDRTAKDMATYCVILKKELCSSISERRTMSDDRHRLRKLLHSSRMQCQQLQQRADQLQRQLASSEEQLNSLELTNQQLQKQVETLKATVALSGGDSRNSVLTRLLSDSPTADEISAKRRLIDPAVASKSSGETESGSMTSLADHSDDVIVSEDSPRAMLATAGDGSANQRRLRNVQSVTSSLVTSSPALVTSRNPFSNQRAVRRSALVSRRICKSSLANSQSPRAVSNSGGMVDCVTAGWDGLGGSSRPETFPRARSRLNMRLQHANRGGASSKGISVVTIDNFFSS